MNYIDIIFKIIGAVGVFMTYYIHKEKFSPPLIRLKGNVNVLYSNYYVRLFLQTMNTAMTILLIFLGFFAGIGLWVLKFQQSTGGLFLGLALFSLFIMFSIFYYISNDIFDYTEKNTN